MKNITRLTLAVSLTLAVVAAEPSKPSVFQMRLVLDAASADSEEMTIVHQGREGGERREVLNVQRKPLIDESSLKSAMMVTDRGTGNPEIEIAFTEQGQQRFAEVTGQNIGKRLAIIIDGRLYSAPVIRSVISGGKGMISGKFTKEEAADLAAKIGRAVRK
jgi:preprotein translocase subunit SecD